VQNQIIDHSIDLWVLIKIV